MLDPTWMGEHGLISRHLQSHYKRINTAKGRTDTSAPVAMMKHIKYQKHKIIKHPSNHPTSKAGTDKSTVNSCDVTMQLDMVMDYNLEATSLLSKEDLYHSETGRRTAQLKKQQLQDIQKKDVTVTPWKPAFNTNSRHSLYTLYPSLNNSAGRADTVKIPPSSLSQSVQDTLCDHTKVEDNTSESYCIKQRRCLAEENAQTKQQLEDSCHEQMYLEFLSTLTQDILSNRILDDSALNDLFQIHVSNNCHKLREDLMWNKIAWLRTELGLSPTS